MNNKVGDQALDGSTGPALTRPVPMSAGRLAVVAVGAVVASLGVCVSLMPVRSDNKLGTGWGANMVAYFAIAAALALLGWRALDVRRGVGIRLWSSILGMIVAITQLLGKSLLMYDTPWAWLDSHAMMLKAVIVAAGFFALTYVLVAVGLEWVLAGRPHVVVRTPSWLLRARCAIARLWRDHPRRFFWWAVAVLVVSRLPYLVRYWPGHLTFDSYSQISQSLGLTALSNHQPVMDTLLIGLFARPAYALGHMTWGVGAYSIAQIVVTSIAIAYAVTRMVSWGIRRWLVGVAYLVWALWPLAGAYSITMWKNVPFAAAMLVVVVMLVDLAKDPSAIRRPAWLIGFGVVLAGVFLLRSDGPYEAVPAMIVAIFLASRGRRKRMLTTMLATLVVALGVRFPVYDALGAAPDLPQSALSVPLQQIARASHNHSANFTPAETAFIADLFKGKTPAQVGQLYNSGLADPVKGAVNTSYLQHNMGQFVSSWIALGERFPADYLDSFLANSYGYWYPEYNMVTISNPATAMPSVPGLTTSAPKASPPHATPTRSFSSTQAIPVVTIVYSTGLAFYLFLFVLAAFAVTRRWRFAWCLVPLAMIWLANLASPVAGDYRYASDYIVAIPVMLPLALSAVKSAATQRLTPR